jgi:hypothetical protein
MARFQRAEQTSPVRSAKILGCGVWGSGQPGESGLVFPMAELQKFRRL